MADRIDAKIIWRATSRDMQAIERATDRATMYAVRAAGRKVKQEAKRVAPTLKASTRGGTISRKQHAANYSPGGSQPPVRGLLRASIHSSKRLRRVGDSYAVRIAPRGERVHFYSQRIEALTGYMRTAYERVAPELRVIAAEAWRKAQRGRR